MSDYLDAVERQLAGLCREGAGRRRRFVPRRPARGGSALWLAASAAVVVLVAAIALTLRASSSSPHAPATVLSGAPLAQLSARQRQRLDTYLRPVIRPNRGSPGCAPGTATPAPDRPTATPSAALMRSLAVLRRPASGADSITGLPRGIRPGGAYLRYVRLAATLAGARYYVVPHFVPASLTPHCAGLIRSAAHAELPRVPASLRLAFTQAIDATLSTAQPHDDVSLLAVEAAGPNWGFDLPASRIASGDAVAIDPIGTPLVYGIAPDGVARVRVTVTARRGPISVSAPVSANVFAVSAARGRFVSRVLSVTWYAANRRVLATLTPRGPQSGQASGPGPTRGAASGAKRSARRGSAHGG